MKVHEAMKVLARSPEGSTISRPGGAVVRLAVGTEALIHRYVTRTDLGVRRFDATPEDLSASDWSVHAKAPDREFLRAQEAEERKSRDSVTRDDL